MSEIPKTAERIIQSVCELQEMPPIDHPETIVINVDDLRTIIENHLERLSLNHGMSEWRTIDTAPKDVAILLVGGCYHGAPFPGYWDESEYAPDRPWVSIVNCSRLYKHVPTHWMPLPAPPSTNQSNTKGTEA